MRFIRVNGRVVPIKDGNSQPKKKNKSINKMKSDYMMKSAKKDEQLAKTGRKIAAVSAFGAAAGVGLGVFRKNKSALVAGIALGANALLNSGFASGREMAAKDRKGYAKSLSKGEKIKRGTGIGAASERAYSEASFLSKVKKKK